MKIDMWSGYEVTINYRRFDRQGRARPVAWYRPSGGEWKRYPVRAAEAMSRQGGQMIAFADSGLAD